MKTNMLSTFLTRKSQQKKLARRLQITTPHGIVEERFIKIGGIEQWVTIRGEDRANPVLLFIHGGPGSTYTIFASTLRSWEKYFTIVQWDQPGTGRTFHKTGKSGTGQLSFERFVCDGLELVEYLCKHLEQEKIILIGSSLGSIVGTIMAKRRPDLFWAYIGTDQNTGGSEAAKLSYQLTLDWLRQYGNTKGVQAVEQISPDPDRWSHKEAGQLVQWTIKANPTIPNMVTDIILPAMLTSPGYTLRDIFDMFGGMKFSANQLAKEMATIDLRPLGMRFEVPFFIFQGDTDAVTPTAAAKKYFDELEVPHKEFALLKQAGHLAVFARQEQFLQELRQRVSPVVEARRHGSQ
ncbi:alpha/beta hydrolase [Ktedonosporobacter rubrisoli]|uniref:Alpha/beta hydrolase n=1 Tax=Ktedonosporobacter rubrisoli TaxID=2509675 RepID=A0A4P6JM97_KTERU|nr:alpha/beta hydrolase [Ktedonosporobacter rubrisoli]QBD76170.1 alpha/beta hydrolase [Ktedonosporobacter rubrisoli]